MFTRLLPFALLVVCLSPASGGEDSWKKLLTLAGEWEGEYEGRKSMVTYTVISGGYALMESMKMPAPEPDMVTIYHRDGASLVATHYCSMGNQPRMRSDGVLEGGKSIRFRFADITNLAKPGAGHIRHLTVIFEDTGRLTQEWVSSAEGKEQSAVFKWTCKQKK